MAISGNNLGANRVGIGISGPPYASVIATLRCSGTTGHSPVFSIDQCAKTLQVGTPIVSSCIFRVKQALRGVTATYINIPDLDGVTSTTNYTGGKLHTYIPFSGGQFYIEATANAMLNVQVRA